MKRIISSFGLLLFSCCIYSQTTKAFSTTTNFIDTFKGYKVDTNALKLSRQKDFGKSYWLNAPVLSDIIVAFFQKNYEVYNPPQGEAYCVFSTGICNGDFNNDGFIDVFNGGAAYGGKKANLSFLIWNPITKKFEEKNLINDKTNFIGNPRAVTPVFINSDNYVDLIIQGSRDEAKDTNLPEPVSICLSDGKGGYDITKLELEPQFLSNKFQHEKGDVNDVDGDGYPDLTVPTGSHTYIFWGTPNFPYLTNQNFAHFSSDTVNFISNNGFGEIVPDGAGDKWASHFDDINGDGLLDLLLGGSEDSSKNIHQKILLNQGKGRFNKNGIIKLPFFKNIPNYIPTTNNGINLFHHISDDLNGDGLIDIVALNATHHKYWYLSVYIQQNDKSFKIDTSWIVYTTHYHSTNSQWKMLLVYRDFDGDGKKDISYIDAGIEAYTDSTNSISRKTVFIRTGNSFVEKDFFQFDGYAKFILDSLKGKPNCPLSYMDKPIFSQSKLSFCQGDSIKISINNPSDTLKWYYETKQDLSNISSKTFLESAKLYVTRTNKYHCVISSDTIQIKKYGIPSPPTLSRDTANFLLSGVTGTTWYKDGSLITDTTQKFKPATPGSYTAKTTQNGCVSALSAPYYYLVTDIINLSKDEYIKLAPNPFVNQLNFDFVVKGYQRLNMEVYDIATGTKVVSHPNITAGSTIPFGQLSSGTYIIRITSNDNKIVHQFKMVKL